VKQWFFFARYISFEANDPTGILEYTLKKAVAAESAVRKLEQGIRAGFVSRRHGNDWITEARDKTIISSEEADMLRELEELSKRVIAVDHFDRSELVPHYLEPDIAHAAE